MTRVKICGITRLEDALAAVEAGAELLGFNFYPPSPRSILPEKCAQISAVLAERSHQVTLVGVFVNFSAQRVNAILDECGLHLAQLHGDEPPEMLASFGGRAFKALRGVPASPETARSYAACRQNLAPALLVDALTAGLYGGSGVTADWPAAAQLSAQYPLLLAGGLTPQNVGEAVRQVRPWGVDTASGVESAPGIKEAAKIQAFIQAVRQNEVESGFTGLTQERK